MTKNNAIKYTLEEQAFIKQEKKASDDFNGGRAEALKEFPDAINQTGHLYFSIEDSNGCKYLHVWTDEDYTDDERLTEIGEAIIKQLNGDGWFGKKKDLIAIAYNQYHFGTGGISEYGYCATNCCNMVDQVRWSKHGGIDYGIDD